jgi:hypothetical protein
LPTSGPESHKIRWQLLVSNRDHVFTWKNTKPKTWKSTWTYRKKRTNLDCVCHPVTASQMQWRETHLSALFTRVNQLQDENQVGFSSWLTNHHLCHHCWTSANSLCTLNMLRKVAKQTCLLQPAVPEANFLFTGTFPCFSSTQHLTNHSKQPKPLRYLPTAFKARQGYGLATTKWG